MDRAETGLVTMIATAPAKIDRLSSLLPEVLLIIWELVRNETGTKTVPLSRALHIFQRINLYKGITIKGSRMLKRLIDTLDHSQADLGNLVDQLDLSAIGFELLIRSREEDYLAQIPIITRLAALLPRMTCLSCTFGYKLGDTLLRQIDLFSNLEIVRLNISGKASFRKLKKLQALKTLQLKLVMSDRHLAPVTPSDSISVEINEGDESCLSLESLEILGSMDSPLLLLFLGSVTSTNVQLDFHHDEAIAAVLTALDRRDDKSITTHLALAADASIATHDLDKQLQLLPQLQHLHFERGGLKVSHRFYTSFLKSSPLVTLRICNDFDFHAKDLISALSDPNSAVNLKSIQLDHISIDATLIIGYHGNYEELLDRWREECTMEHIAELVQITKARGIKFYGHTLQAWKTCLDLGWRG